MESARVRCLFTSCEVIMKRTRLCERVSFTIYGTTSESKLQKALSMVFSVYFIITRKYHAKVLGSDSSEASIILVHSCENRRSQPVIGRTTFSTCEKRRSLAGTHLPTNFYDVAYARVCPPVLLLGDWLVQNM